MSSRTKTATSSPPAAPAIARLALTKGTALHRQLLLVLREQIFRGDFEPSGLMPTEEALCTKFGVSRITVRRALSDLAALGLVERRPAVGTFACPGGFVERALPSLGVIDALAKSARETQVQVLEVNRTEAPRDVSSLLRLEPGERAVHAARLRSVDDVPVMLTDAWVPAALGRDVTAAALRKRALYEILMDQIQFGRVVQELRATSADRRQADLLQLEVGAPVLKLVRVMHDSESNPVLHLTVWLSSETSRILMDIPGETVNTLSGGQFVHDVRPRTGK